MKEKRFFPEKGLLMLSGVAFLLLTVPAWVQGFVWCGVAAVLLCVAVWRLPVSQQKVRALLSNPAHAALSLAFNGALAVNFYHIWIDSQKMQRVAGWLGMENGLFVPLCAAFFAIAAAPAAGCVISYYISAGQEDYRRTKAETLRSGETGIPMGKALLILFAVSVVGISAILRANFYYMDDSPRAALGYKQWDYFSRYLSTALATLVHGGDYLVDAAPLPQMLAMLIMAVSGILMGYIFRERTTFSGWELAVLSILGLNPYFLGCVSFRFDAPYMALSVLAAVVPLLYRNRNTAAYVLASGLGILAVCTSYQAAAGIFLMLVVALALRMWNRGKSIREVGLFCLKSAAGYALGLLFFKLVIMIPADTNYVGNALPSAGELIPHFLENLRSYYSLILSDFKPFWRIAAVLAVSIFRLIVHMSSGRFRAGVLIPAAVAIVLGAVSFFVCSSADRWTVVNGFDKNRARYNAAAEYLAQQPYSAETELPAEYADLSRGSVKRVECAGGKYICSIFTLLEHENRFEGILYVPGNTPVIYYEITNGWSSYAYEDLGGGYAWIVLYK